MRGAADPVRMPANHRPGRGSFPSPIIFPVSHPGQTCSGVCARLLLLSGPELPAGWNKMQGHFLNYSVTALIIGSALVCQFLVYSLTPVTAPFMFFSFIVLITAWFLGWPAGIFATLLSTLALEYFFIHPVGFFLRSPIDYVTSLIFLAGTGFIVFLVEAKRRADQRAAVLANELEARVAERTRALERTMQELASKQALAAVGLAAASIAHEIGNPLQVLSLSLFFLERENENKLDERARQELASMKTEIARLLDLLSELKDASRPARLEIAPADLTQQARDVLRSLEALFAAQNVRLVDRLADDLPPVRADAGKLKQVIVNLCKNAVEAMPHGGTLTLQTHCLRGVVCLEVQDTGTGILPGADVFNAFATSKPEGWGLGLPIVYQIVTAHNGSIEYESGGRGTIFKVSLPSAA